MKLVLLSLFFPFVLHAAPKAPGVLCHLSWDLSDKDGGLGELDNAEPLKVPLSLGDKFSSTELRNFKLEVRLLSAGPAGGATKGYQTEITLKHGTYEAFHSQSTTGQHRHSLTLITGKERAHVNCDITKK